MESVEKNNRNIQTVFLALLFALFILLLGFGVLCIMNEYVKYDDSLPGFYHYYAATFGDGLFLPLACAFGGFIIIDSREKKIPLRKQEIVIPIFGMLIAIFIQTSWIVSGSTALNWTIPKIHHFNIAGWYHAFYFVFMFALIIFLLVRVRSIIDDTDYKYIKSLIGMFLSLSGYWYMHLIDDYTNKDNYIIWLWLSLVMSEIIFVLFLGKKALSINRLIRIHIPFFIGSSFLSIFYYVLCECKVYMTDVDIFVEKILLKIKKIIEMLL